MSVLEPRRGAGICLNRRGPRQVCQRVK